MPRTPLTNAEWCSHYLKKHKKIAIDLRVIKTTMAANPEGLQKVVDSSEREMKNLWDKAKHHATLHMKQHHHFPPEWVKATDGQASKGNGKHQGPGY